MYCLHNCEQVSSKCLDQRKQLPKKIRKHNQNKEHVWKTIIAFIDAENLLTEKLGILFLT